MNRKRKPCAAFLWTHRGHDRDRIKNDTPLDVALAQSVTLKVQHKKAGEMARLAGFEISKVFLFEETGHLPTFKVFPTINLAMSWCERNDAPLIIHSFRHHSGRGFSSLTTGRIKFQTEINHRGIQIIWIDPADRDEALHEYFEQQRDKERQRRRDKIKKLRRTAGLKKFISDGGKLGFAAEWANKKDAQSKGRAAQSDAAKERAKIIIDAVKNIKSDHKSVPNRHLADIINAMMMNNPELLPPRGTRWTEFSIRIYIKRHGDSDQQDTT
ncbi:protein of unknown function [Magnetospirillum sp. XM-1]|nr:protein of unknown function [Magnetospirillum sp. XM-1]